MIEKIKSWVFAFSFRKKIGIILLLFAIVPSAFVQQIMMNLYEKNILENASNNIHSVVFANNKVLRMMLKQIENVSGSMLNEEYYYNVFSDFNEASESDYMEYDRRVASELARQFTAQKEVYESYLYTSKWVIGKKGVMNTPINNIKKSGMVEKAVEAQGHPVWIAGYNFGEAMQSEFLLGKENYEYQYPITMVRQMNFQYNYLATYSRLGENDEKPILFVYILEKEIRNIYKDSIEYEESMYGISDETETILSSDTKTLPITAKLPAEIAKFHGQSGYTTCVLNGQEYVLCYDTIEEYEWYAWALVPMKVLVRDTLKNARLIQIGAWFVFLPLSIGVSYWLSKSISSPVGKLIAAAKRVATGNFKADTPIPKGRDFKILTESFNQMETEIERLIHENYEIVLREKEMQLMALSLQINPHFLYNTLNTINMLAIQNEDEETSDMIVSLSEMLHFTFKNTSEKILLTDEIGWLTNYIAIMSARFKNVFTAEFYIEEEVLECKVPKFFLQPLVENAIMHGFREVKQGGLIQIRAKREGDTIHFEVQDNGKGMDEEEIKQHITLAAKDGGIGISNVHRRLMLIYEEKYRVEVTSQIGTGTLLNLYIPYEA